jgi:hypothetical protein
MSSSPPPESHPGASGQPAPSQEKMAANTRPADPLPPVQPQGVPAPRPTEQTAPIFGSSQRERMQPCRKESGQILPPLELSPPSFDRNVYRRGLDPFVIGVVVGAVTAIIGFLIGLLYFLLT